jgi:hypothetical protein
MVFPILMSSSPKLDIFDPLLGKAPWNVQLGIGSFLTLEFGPPETESFRGKTKVHGQWHLWLQDCAWRIEKDNRINAASGDDHQQLSLAITKLQFGSLEKAEVNDFLDISLNFAGGLRLRTFTADSSENEQWELFKPDGMVLVAHAGGALIETPRGWPSAREAPIESINLFGVFSEGHALNRVRPLLVFAPRFHPVFGGCRRSTQPVGVVIVIRKAWRFERQPLARGWG